MAAPTSASSSQSSGGLGRGPCTVHLPLSCSKRSKLKTCQRRAPGRRKGQLGMRHQRSVSRRRIGLRSRRSSHLMKRFGHPASPGSTLATRRCPLGEKTPIHQEGIKNSTLFQLIRSSFARTSSWKMTTHPHRNFRLGNTSPSHRGPPDSLRRLSVTRMCTSLMQTLFPSEGGPTKCSSHQSCR
jgi:hypothetical protein